jgi:hypothetical protein
MMAPSPLYHVQLKVGREDCPALTLPCGPPAMVMVNDDFGKEPRLCQVGVRLQDAGDGRVKLFLHTYHCRVGCGGFPSTTEYHGEKKVHPETPTNVVLGGDDPEPISAEVLVKAVAMPYAVAPVYSSPPMPAVALQYPTAPTCPAPVTCPAPAPPAVAVMPAPMPVPAPSVYLPEPMALPAPTPVVERCTATEIVQTCCSAAHVELVRCCHKCTLAVKCEGVCAKSVRMTLDKGECGPLTVAAGKKYVHVHGKKWTASADEVEILGDGRVLLKGHVKLLSDTVGVCASVRADQLCVKVKNGSFEKIIHR